MNSASKINAKTASRQARMLLKQCCRDLNTSIASIAPPTAGRRAWDFIIPDQREKLRPIDSCRRYERILAFKFIDDPKEVKRNKVTIGDSALIGSEVSDDEGDCGQSGMGSYGQYKRLDDYLDEEFGEAEEERAREEMENMKAEEQKLEQMKTAKVTSEK